MKRTACTQSLAGLPFNTIALAISANAHAVDQRTIEARFLGAVLVILFFLYRLGRTANWDSRQYTL